MGVQGWSTAQYGRRWLLFGHGDAEAFLGGDQVVGVGGGGGDVELDPSDLAGEGVPVGP